MNRNEINLDVGGANDVILEVLPFEWPRSAWEILELVADESTGWRDANTAAITKLKALYNGAHGRLSRGLGGFIVQYVQGTGRTPFTITDWRGNTGQGVFIPDEGLQISEIHGTATEVAPLGSAHHRLRMRMVLV